ncbi:MAG: hypothetical protein ABUL54_05785 [Dongia sp.]
MTMISLRKAAVIAAFGMAATFAAGYAIAAQPHMQAALRALRNADGELNAALPDKGGHRVKAIGLVNDAIAETEAGIAAGM